jgi:hypothetical protein
MMENNDHKNKKNKLNATTKKALEQLDCHCKTLEEERSHGRW